MLRYNILIVCLLLFNCTNEVKKAHVNNTVKLQDRALLSKGDIAKFKFNDILLDKSAQNLTQDWEAYNAIKTSIDAIKELKFIFFTEQDDIFKTTLLELKTTIPEKLNSQPINARLLIVQNNLLRLQEELKIKKQLSVNDLVFIKSVFISFSNLNLQINKKIEKEAQNIIKP